MAMDGTRIFTDLSGDGRLFEMFVQGFNINAEDTMLLLGLLSSVPSTGKLFSAIVRFYGIDMRLHNSAVWYSLTFEVGSNGSPDISHLSHFCLTDLLQLLYSLFHLDKVFKIVISAIPLYCRAPTLADTNCLIRLHNFNRKT